MIINVYERYLTPTIILLRHKSHHIRMVQTTTIII